MSADDWRAFQDRMLLFQRTFLPQLRYFAESLMPVAANILLSVEGRTDYGDTGVCRPVLECDLTAVADNG